MNQAQIADTSLPPAVTFSVQDGIATLAMTRPKQRNPFSPEFQADMARFLQDIRRREDIDALILTGADGIFSGGGDVKGMNQSHAVKSPPVEKNRTRIYKLHDWLQILRTIEIPVIAAVDGPAYGGGFGLALCADFILCTPRARFCSVFCRIGIIPDCGVLFTLPRMIGMQRAKEIMYTGRPVDAAEAKALGIVMDIVEPEQLMPASGALTKRMQQSSRAAFGITKRIANQAFDVDASGHIEMEAAGQAICLASEYHKDAAQRFAEKRPLRFNWERPEAAE